MPSEAPAQPDPPPAPLVSVVIPTYNQATLLLETLGSVFAQTLADYEVVVVDDGSPDDTLARLRPLQDVHGPRRLRVVTQPNAGTGAARNRGIDEARGRYVALLDHDDLWMPRKLEVQAAYLAAHPQCVAAVVPYALSSDPGRPVFDAAALGGAGDGVVGRPLRKAADKQPLFMTCSVLMFDRARAHGVRFGTERGAIEDVQFYARLMARGRLGIAGHDRPGDVLAVYRTHAANASRETSYLYAGLRLLRRMDRGDAFAELPPADRADLRSWLGFVGRATAVTQLLIGNRARGLATYAAEFPHQLRERRLDFLAAYPVFALGPRRLVQAWHGRGAKR